MSNEHIIRQRIINFDPQKEDPSKTGDPVRIFFKKISDWNMTYDVDEYGKVSIQASKPLGSVESLAQGTDREASIDITVNSTQKRAPPLKIVGGYRYEPKYLELDDKLDRCTESFKQEDQYHKRLYSASSILTTEEFFYEMLPTFWNILKDKTFNTSVTKITEETSKVQKPYNRSWRNAK